MARAWRRCLAVALVTVLTAMTAVRADENRSWWQRMRHGLADRVYDEAEQTCLAAGWQKLTFPVEGRPRKLLWRAPAGPWTKGVILGLHGGGGCSGNWGDGLRLNEPMRRFAAMAVERGFALFALDSLDGVTTDEQGRSCGKRWDCVDVPGRTNVDLPYVRYVIDVIVPAKCPPGSNAAVFMTGISNGGFMTILASTALDDRVTAFAPVSAGDPYGTVMDMGTHPKVERAKAPGVFRDRETGRTVSEPSAALAEAYPHERPWQTTNPQVKPAFKQFHHEGDALCDVSLMRKAHRLLVEHGYRDDGPMVLPATERSLWHHFWQDAYNAPLLDFFARQLR